MTENLKSFQLCGEKEVKLFKEGRIWVVECQQCFAKVGTMAEAYALDFWNYRLKEIVKLKEENKSLIGALKAIKKLLTNNRCRFMTPREFMPNVATL